MYVEDPSKTIAGNAQELGTDTAPEKKSDESDTVAVAADELTTADEENIVRQENTVTGCVQCEEAVASTFNQQSASSSSAMLSSSSSSSSSPSLLSTVKNVKRKFTTPAILRKKPRKDRITLNKLSFSNNDDDDDFDILPSQPGPSTSQGMMRNK